MTKPLHKRRWFKWCTSIIILFLLFISVLPIGIRYFIVDWFEKQGIEQVKLEDINLNLFTGNVTIINMLVSTSEQEMLSVDNLNVNFDWLPLFKKRSFFPALKIHNLNLLIQQNADNSLTIAGINIPESKKAPDTTAKQTWGFGLHSIEVSSSEINIHTPEQKAKFHLDNITLDKIESWSEQNSQLNFNGKINNADVSIAGKINLFSKQPGFNGNVSIKELDLSPLSVNLKEQLENISGKLDMDASIQLSHIPGKSTDIQIESTLLLKNLVLALASQEIDQDKLYWQGNSKILLTTDSKAPSFTIKGKVNSENFSLKPNKMHHYHHGQLSWDGQVQSSDASNIPAVTGQLTGQDITVTQTSDQLQIFHTNTLSVNNIIFNDINDIQTGEIKLSDIRSLFKPESNKKSQRPALIQASNLNVSGVELKSDNNIKIGRINFTDALIYLHILKNGELSALSKLAKPENKKESAQAETTPATDNTESKPLKFTLAEFNLKGNSRIHVLDESVAPVFTTELKLKQAFIKNINSGNPDAASPFAIDANLDKYSSITANGDVHLFSKPISLNLKSNIKNISLPPVSSYTAKTIGHDLRSGQLNADIKLKITKGEIDAINKLLISNLEIKPSDPKKAAALTSQISMPLDSALSLLRDKKNDIKLELPITGNINKPDFNISGIINKALGTALKKTTMTYLTLALQPYGAIISLVKMADKAANAVNLSPVSFAANSSNVDETGKDYLSKINKLMQDRPQLRIKLCGKAVNTDRDYIKQEKHTAWLTKQKAIIKKKNLSPAEQKKLLVPPTFTIADETLLNLALQRADAIKEILVNEHKIGAERLFLCQPAIDTEKESKPRLDINI